MEKPPPGTERAGRREVHVPVYWLIVGVAVMLVSPMLSILASVQLVEHRAAQQAAANRDDACQFIDIWLRTFDETPPTTESGKNLRRELQVQYERVGCLPPRE